MLSVFDPPLRIGRARQSSLPWVVVSSLSTAVLLPSRHRGSGDNPDDDRRCHTPQGKRVKSRAGIMDVWMCAREPFMPVIMSAGPRHRDGPPSLRICEL